MADETSILEAWLYGVLTGDSVIAALITARVYPSVAPQAAPRPYIVVSYQQGADVNGCGERGLAQPLYQIRAIGKHADIATLRALAGQIDALLQDTRVTFAGYRIRVQRESPLRGPEFNDGVEYEAKGGMYRCWISIDA